MLRDLLAQWPGKNACANRHSFSLPPTVCAACLTCIDRQIQSKTQINIEVITWPGSAGTFCQQRTGAMLFPQCASVNTVTHNNCSSTRGWSTRRRSGVAFKAAVRAGSSIRSLRGVLVTWTVAAAGWAGAFQRQPQSGGRRQHPPQRRRRWVQSPRTPGATAAPCRGPHTPPHQPCSTGCEPAPRM